MTEPTKEGDYSRRASDHPRKGRPPFKYTRPRPPEKSRTQRLRERLTGQTPPKISS